jgi:hypothetical protein
VCYLFLSEQFVPMIMEYKRCKVRALRVKGSGDSGNIYDQRVPGEVFDSVKKRETTCFLFEKQNLLPLSPSFGYLACRLFLTGRRKLPRQGTSDQGISLHSCEKATKTQSFFHSLDNNLTNTPLVGCMLLSNVN